MIANFKSITLLIAYMVFACFSVYSQTDCALILKQAEKTYDEGNIEKVPEQLKECIKNGFNKDQKIRAYILIIKSYLFDDEYEMADEYMLKLLSFDPEYQINEAVEPVEFVNLFKSYRTMPLYSVGFFGGVNASQVSILETYSVGDLNTLDKSFGATKLGFQFGLSINRLIANRVELSLEPSFMQTKFEYIEEPFDFSVITCNETHSKLHLPLTAMYYLGYKKVIPYLRAGGAANMLMSSSLMLVRSYDVETEESVADVKGSDISLKDNRRQLNFDAVIGAGVKYKIPRGRIGLDVTYNFGLINQVVEDNRYNNNELLYKYYYIDNDYLLNNLAVSFSYVYLIYKPVKNKK